MRQEVGKVAKAAPVLISKCLEMLIGDLVKSASKVCKSKNAATVNVNHLREAVAKEQTFDFLQEVLPLPRACLIASCRLHACSNTCGCMCMHLHAGTQKHGHARSSLTHAQMHTARTHARALARTHIC